MSRFYVGQRVRIVHTTQLHHFCGLEATIVESMPDNFWRLSIAGSGFAYYAKSWQLEPLTDCYEKTTWESMSHLWTPERRESA